MKSRLKLCLLSFSSMLLIYSSAAQNMFSEGTTIPETGIEINPIIDTILFWDLGSGAGFWLGLTMFIVVWLGFHFATRPFLQQIFEAMLDHFPSSNSRTNINRNDEGEIKGINALSLLAAFTAAQLIGQFFGLIPLVVLGVGPVIMAAWGTYKGSSSFRNDFGEYLRGENSDSGDGTNLDEQFEEMKNELRDEFEREEDIKRKISRLRGNRTGFDEAVEELEDSNLRDGVKADLEKIKNEWHDEQEKEYTLAEVLDEIASEEQTEIQEEMEIAELEEYIETELSHLVNLDRDMDQRIDQMRSELEEMKRREEEEGLTPELREELDRFHDQLGQTRAEVKEAIREAEDAKDAAERAREMYGELDRDTQQTENRVQEAEKEDEEVTAEAEDEEEKFSELGAEIKQGASNAGQLREQIGEISDAVDMEEAIAEEEDTETREEVNEMEKIKQEKEQIKNLIQGDNSKLSQVAQDLKEKIDKIQEMEQIAGASLRYENEDDWFPVENKAEKRKFMQNRLNELEMIEKSIQENPENISNLKGVFERMGDISNHPEAEDEDWLEFYNEVKQKLNDIEQQLDKRKTKFVENLRIQYGYDDESINRRIDYKYE